MKEIDKTTPYFRDVDLSKRLDRFVESYKDDSEKTIETVINQLNDSSLNPVEEMLVLEIALRIVYSDTKELYQIKVQMDAYHQEKPNDFIKHYYRPMP